MKYAVELADSARRQIHDCVRYIADDQKSPENAEKWLDDVWEAIDSLEVFPHGFSIAPENEYREYEIRMRIIGHHVLTYTVDEPEKVVYVIGLRHGAQLPRPAELPNDLDELK